MTRLSLLGLGIRELFLRSSKENKSAECVIRLLDAPLQLAGVSIKLSDPQLSQEQKINTFGNQISRHIALFRGCLEHELLATYTLNLDREVHPMRFETKIIGLVNKRINEIEVNKKMKIMGFFMENQSYRDGGMERMLVVLNM